MIYQSIDSDYSVCGYPKALIEALDYLKTTDFLSMESGVYKIKEDMLFAQVFDYTSRSFEECRPEYHKKYLDIQFWPDAMEKVGFAPVEKNTRVIEALEPRDLYYVTPPEKENFINVKKRDYVVFFPSDVHRPGILLDSAKTYRKVVVKLNIELLK